MKIIIQCTDRGDSFYVPSMIEQIQNESPNNPVSLSLTGRSREIKSYAEKKGLELHSYDSLLRPVQHFVRILKIHQASNAYDEDLLVLEDDIAFVPGMIRWLESGDGWPAGDTDIGCLSLYVDAETQSQIQGDHQWIERIINRDDLDTCNAGTCALFIPSESVPRILALAKTNRRKSTGHYLLDIFMVDGGLKWIYHNPSLVQHVGEESTIGLGGNQAYCRRAATIPKSMDAYVCKQSKRRHAVCCDRQRVGIR